MATADDIVKLVDKLINLLDRPGASTSTCKWIIPDDQIMFEFNDTVVMLDHTPGATKSLDRPPIKYDKIAESLSTEICFINART